MKAFSYCPKMGVAIPSFSCLEMLQAVAETASIVNESPPGEAWKCRAADAAVADADTFVCAYAMDS